MSSDETSLFAFPDSDFALVSAEGDRFPVDKTLLSAVSTVFKDILAVPQESNQSKTEIKVTEKTELLDLFLRFLHRGPDPEKLPFETVCALLELTDKYDVPIVRPALATALLEKAPVNPMEAWAVLMIFGQRAAAKRCFLWMDKTPSHSQNLTVYPVGKTVSARRYTPAFIPVNLLARVPGPDLQELLAMDDRFSFKADSTWFEKAAVLYD